MNIYLRDGDTFHNYDHFMWNKIIDGKYNLYDYSTDPYQENSLFILNIDWSSDFTLEQIEALHKIKNKRVLFLNHHHCIDTYQGSHRVTFLKDSITKLGFEMKNTYLMVQTYTDMLFVKEQLGNEIHVEYNDKWLAEFMFFQGAEHLIDRDKRYFFNRNNQPVEETEHKKFSIFNRRFDERRFDFFCELLASNLLDDFHYTFTNSHGNNVGEKLELSEIKKLISNRFINHKDKIEHWINNMPYEVGSDNLSHPYPIQLNRFYLNSDINVVCETHPEIDYSIISEKTYKAMFFEKPFVLVSQQNALKFLKKSGYQTFSPYINESYDDIADYNLRKTAAINEINRLNNLPIDQFNDILEKCKAITKHNVSVLLDHYYRPWPEYFKLKQMLNFENA